MLPNEAIEAIRRYRGQRGPQKSPTKELISLRVDRDVAAAATVLLLAPAAAALLLRRRRT